MSKTVLGILVSITVLLGLFAEIFLFSILGFETEWAVVLGTLVIAIACTVGYRNATGIPDEYTKSEEASR
jgi:heme O synthase-like polyprenyltransferase